MNWPANKILLGGGALAILAVSFLVSRPGIDLNHLLSFIGITIGETNTEDLSNSVPSTALVSPSNTPKPTLTSKIKVTPTPNLLSPGDSKLVTPSPVGGTSATNSETVNSRPSNSNYTPTPTPGPSSTHLVSPSPMVTPSPSITLVTPAPTATPATTTSSSLININTAGLAELDKITGIGPVYAQRIIDYREANGPFQKIEEIKEVKGIGEVTFQKMKSEITVGL